MRHKIAKQFMARQRALRSGKIAVPQGGIIGVDRAPIARGRLKIELRPAEQKNDPRAWVPVVDDPNLVVTRAEQIMAQMAIGAANSAISYIELGDPAFPAQAPALTDTTLQQTTGQRKSTTNTASGNVSTHEVLFDTTEANGFTFTEAGLFNGILGAGLMFARKTFTGITKTNSFQMRFTWNITYLVNTQGGDCAGVSLIGPSTVAAKTLATAAGGEASVAATFDFVVGADHVDVFVDRQRLYSGVHYVEVGAGGLTAPVLGPAGNKGINFVGYTLSPGDEVMLIQRTLA